MTRGNEYLAYRRIMLVRPPSACGMGSIHAPLAVNLEYIAAYIASEVDEIKIVNQEFDDSPIEPHIKEFDPDLFGVTMQAVDHVNGLNLCKTASKMGVDTVMGGFHATAVPDVLLGYKQVKMIVRGEGEATMRELVKRGSPVGVKGMSYRSKRAEDKRDAREMGLRLEKMKKAVRPKGAPRIVHEETRPVIPNLDSLPFPARHLRRGDECELYKKHAWPHMDEVHNSRGCWGKCTFCNEPSMSQSRQRFRSAESTFKEILEVYKYHDEGKTFVLFGDPHFLGRPRQVDQLCDMLIDADLDMTFSTMLRADVVAKQPKVIKKMVQAGIATGCMGLESPNLQDLDETWKGITNKTHEDAVNIWRWNHGMAGGTFVIGLPHQTEEEIKSFPEYARYLGLLNAGFGIATPLPGTPFYDELDEQGLIYDHDFTHYDEMHSVFHHKTIDRETMENLQVYCMGRFYAPDLFIDDIIEHRLRDHDGKKITLAEAAAYFGERLSISNTPANNYESEKGGDKWAIFLQAMINPYTRKRLEKIGIHNVLELSDFLRVFGDQKIQISLYHKGAEVVHFVMKTTKTTVEYIDASAKPHPDATVTIEADLEDIGKKVPPSKMGMGILKKIARRKQLLTLMRMGLAGFVDYVKNTRGKNKKVGKMTIPEEYPETQCKMSGWEKAARRSS